MFRREATSWLLFLFLTLFIEIIHAQEISSSTTILDKNRANTFSNIQYQNFDLEFNEIIHHSKGWKNTHSVLFDAGFSSQPYWFKQELVNPSKNHEWFLTLNNTRLDFVDFYLVSDGEVQHLASGDYRPISKQPSSSPTFKFYLDEKKSAQLYIRVQSGTKVSFLPTVRGSFKYGQYSSIIKMMHIFYAFILLAFIIFQIVLNQRATDKITLYYAAGLCFGFAYNLFYFGEGNLLFWPDNSALKNRSHYVFALLCCAFFSLFLQKYLRSSITMPRLHSLLKWYLVCVLIGITITLFPVGNLTRVIVVLLVASALIFLASSGTVRAVLRESYWALWFATPLIFTMLSTLVYVSTFLGFLPYTLITSTLLLWSFLFDIVLISLSLIFRHYALRHERDELLSKLDNIANQRTNDGVDKPSTHLPSEIANGRELNSRLSNINPHATIVRLVQYLDKEKAFLEAGLSVESVASIIDVRPDQLSALISSELNTSFPTLINIKRLNAAAKMLIDDQNKQVLNIALECGFNSKSNFNRLFKEYFNTTPTLYRKLYTQKS